MTRQPVTDSPIGRRIIIVGGGGKSMLARTLAERLDLPCVELDALFWGPEWTEAEDDVFRARIAEATAGDSWIVDGSYSRTYDVHWPRAQCVIWLDYSLAVVFWRVLRRCYRRWRDDELLWGTNRERFWHQFYSRDSLLLFILRRQGRLRRLFKEASALAEWMVLPFVRLRSPRETKRWLAETVAPAPLAPEPALDEGLA